MRSLKEYCILIKRFYFLTFQIIQLGRVDIVTKNMAAVSANYGTEDDKDAIFF